RAVSALSKARINPLPIYPTIPKALFAGFSNKLLIIGFSHFTIIDEKDRPGATSYSGEFFTFGSGTAHKKNRPLR
ncbi:MAG: hypothetical protein WBC05_12065, partial [Sedimentisphaerales bacterium]